MRAPCDPPPLSFQTKELIFELQMLSHMLLFASKSSLAFGAIMQHYRVAAREFQNKVCGRRHSRMGIRAGRPDVIGLPC